MKANNPYLLSIIIPTRNRQPYALAAVNHILSSTSDEVQVVIQDNSDSNSLFEQVMQGDNTHRIKYSYSPVELSFVDNFSKGVELADGDYVCMIGDDDGINPEIEEFVRWAKLNNIEAITPEIHLNYIWPNTGNSYYKKDTGNLTIVDFNLSFKFYDPKKELMKLLNSGGQNYLKYNLVKIYHGIIKRSLMDDVKKVTGRYFGGLSPDIYSSVALSLVTNKVLKIDYPLTIPGVCRKSGSGHSSTGRHHGNLENAPQLKGHTDYQWSTLVPRFYSVETLWADSSIAGFYEMGRFDLLKKFNVIRLSAYCYINYKQFSTYTTENLKRYRLNTKKSQFGIGFKLVANLFLGPINDLRVRIINKLFRKKNSVLLYTDVTDICAAEEQLKNYLKSNATSVADIIDKLNNK